MTQAGHENRGLLMRSLKVLVALLPVGILTLAGYFMYEFLQKHSLEEIMAQIHDIPTRTLWVASVLTFFAYLLLSTYDTIAFIYLRNRLSRWKVVSTSLVAYALSNSTGFGGVAGNAWRFRNYMHYGVKGFDIVKVASLIIISFWLGTFTITGFSFLFFPLDVSRVADIPRVLFQVIGGVLIALVGLYAALAYYRREPFTFRGREIRFPSFRLTLMQISLATADWILAASVLYVLMPKSANLEFPMFVAIFASSTLIGLFANVPGGIGILEALILFFVGARGATPAQIMGSLLVYRFIYNFCPFIIALASVGLMELKRHGLRLLKPRTNPL